ncbi:pilus assembly protein [Geoalkalibacter halelectricus]|uniref:PilY1 beta-propeller domain-containing protein n=1 Tax=Geoalkalibacter halelectricus TaxID=2847045 RepID=A0ABY5ZJ37_9BACT|nr:PilC/PilY family type IV pilus protein [Geoalkalibacter halelectricus]MDO3377784.1 PilC/PilY family type IV pilus protein [Geoalkalibacter halelectricus]UWZ78623.1 hypothetical protein L9S41_13155 [Geoalkalibacter halelectricus]
MKRALVVLGLAIWLGWAPAAALGAPLFGVPEFPLAAKRAAPPSVLLLLDTTEAAADTSFSPWDLARDAVDQLLERYGPEGAHFGLMSMAGDTRTTHLHLPCGTPPETIRAFVRAWHQPAQPPPAPSAVEIAPTRACPTRHLIFLSAQPATQAADFDARLEDLVCRSVPDADPEASVETILHILNLGAENALPTEVVEHNGGRHLNLPAESSQLFAAFDPLLTGFFAPWAQVADLVVLDDRRDNRELLVRAGFAPAEARGDLRAWRLSASGLEPAEESPLWSAAALLASRPAATRHILTPTGPAATLSPWVDSGPTLSHLQTLWDLDGPAAAALINAVREQPLGTLIHSTPLVVGAPRAHHRTPDYAEFRLAHQTRPTLIYTAANTGLLHAFSAFGAADLPAGGEAWAFIPAAVQQRIGQDQHGSHRYLLDLAPVAADARDPAWGTGHTAWKTLLIGGGGLGGPAYFALDITDPTPTGLKLLWEAQPFVGALAATRPLIGPILPSGSWVALFTSGPRSDDRPGGLRALALRDGAPLPLAANGASTLPVGSKTSAQPFYGLSDPVGIDSTGDGYLDLIYAGDSEGVLWKFFFDAELRAWRAKPRFDTGGPPISARPTLAIDRRGNLRIYFGTGRYLLDADHDDRRRNAFYGLIETRKDSHPAHPFAQGLRMAQTPADLAEVTELLHGDALAVLEEDRQKKLADRGWFFHLDPARGAPAERVITAPLVVAGTVYFTSLTPAAGPCEFGGTARLYAVAHDSGVPAHPEQHPHGESSANLNQLSPSRHTELGAGVPGALLWRFGRSGRPARLYAPTADLDLNPYRPATTAPGLHPRAWREIMP